MAEHMVSINAEEFRNLREKIPSITDDGIFDTYRISQTTWYKLRDGRPVRRTTLARIFSHYEEICRAESRHLEQ